MTIKFSSYIRSSEIIGCIFMFNCLDYRCEIFHCRSVLFTCQCDYLLRSCAYISIENFRCLCGFCQRQNRVLECVCCSEIDCVVAKNDEAVEAEGLAEPPGCIT